jgi:hypothetical protein
MLIYNTEACGRNASFDKGKFKDSAAERMLRLVVEMRRAEGKSAAGRRMLNQVEEMLPFNERGLRTV